MKKIKILKTILFPTIGITAIGTIAAVSTSCSSAVPATSYICVTSNADSTLELRSEGENNPNLQYSVDGKNWTTYSGILNIPANGKIYLIGDNANGWSLGESKYSYFNIIGNVSISGNIMSLLDNGTGTISSIPNNYCFYKLFIGSEGITSINEDFLPSANLKEDCYGSMFYDCTRLTTAPDLPATTLANNCYSNMFCGCSSLTQTPDLPATALSKGCYGCMFLDCSSLTNAPTLPATTLAEDCYVGMFQGCTSLTTAPDLPATTIANSCYFGMFQGCTLLASVRIGYAGTAAEAPEGAFDNWVSDVASVGIFYYTGTDPDPITNFGFPSGWTINPN